MLLLLQREGHHRSHQRLLHRVVSAVTPPPPHRVSGEQGSVHPTQQQCVWECHMRTNASLVLLVRGVLVSLHRQQFGQATT